MSDHNHSHCGCGHDHDHDHDEEPVFVMTDEDGNEHEMVMVCTFEAMDRTYAVLLDRNEPEADGVIFRIEEEGDEAYLVHIEDEQEWNRVVAIYNDIARQEANA